MRTLLFLFAAGSLAAEYLRIEQGFGGMAECASCSRFIEKKFSGNAGVASVRMDAKKNLVELELKPGNKLRWSQVRDFVQQSGYTPQEAKVSVVGMPLVDRGVTNLRIGGSEEAIRVKDDDGHLREFARKKVSVEGVLELVRTGETALEVLKVTKATLVP